MGRGLNLAVLSHRIAQLPTNLLDLVDLRKKGLYTIWIEVPSALSLEVANGVIRCPSMLVWPFRGQCVVHIGNGYNPRNQRYVLTFQAVRIPASVEPLMMRQRDDGA